MNKEKFDEFKKNLKRTVKDKAPEIIIAGTTVLGFIAYIAYVSRAVAKQDHNCFVTVTERIGGCGLIVSDDCVTQLLEDPSKICYKVDDTHHFSLAPNDCTDVH